MVLMDLPHSGLNLQPYGGELRELTFTKKEEAMREYFWYCVEKDIPWDPNASLLECLVSPYVQTDPSEK